MSEKKTNIKDWLLYVEADKMKAFDITAHKGDDTDNLVHLCRETGIDVFGFVAFEYERDATHYGNMFR
jgi:hypothetical protein